MNEKKNNSENEFGIDLNKNYSGAEVLELIEIVMEEAEKSITQSYQEGYKQGVLEYKPDMEYYKMLYESIKDQNKKTLWQNNLLSLSIGLIAGTYGGFLLTTQLNN